MIICPHCENAIKRAKWWKKRKKKMVKKRTEINDYDKIVLRNISMYLKWRNTAGKIAKRAGIARQTTINHINKMIAMGLVEKFKYNKEDRTQRYVISKKLLRKLKLKEGKE